MNDEALKARAVQIVARSLYRELTAQGFDDKQILEVAIELLGRITDKLSTDKLLRRA